MECISYNSSKVLYFYGIYVGVFLTVDRERLMSMEKREEINLSLISEGITLCAFCVNLACFS